MDWDEFLALMTRDHHTVCERAIFRMFDTDGDGYIVVDELRDLIHMLTQGEGLSRSQVDAMMLEADADGDGRITFEEFKAVVEPKVHHLASPRLDHILARLGATPVASAGGAGAGSTGAGSTSAGATGVGATAHASSGAPAYALVIPSPPSALAAAPPAAARPTGTSPQQRQASVADGGRHPELFRIPTLSNDAPAPPAEAAEGEAATAVSARAGAEAVRVAQLQALFASKGMAAVVGAATAPTVVRNKHGIPVLVAGPQASAFAPVGVKRQLTGPAPKGRPLKMPAVVPAAVRLSHWPSGVTDWKDLTKEEQLAIKAACKQAEREAGARRGGGNIRFSGGGGGVGECGGSGSDGQRGGEHGGEDNGLLDGLASHDVDLIGDHGFKYDEEEEEEDDVDAGDNDGNGGGGATLSHDELLHDEEAQRELFGDIARTMTPQVGVVSPPPRVDILLTACVAPPHDRRRSRVAACWLAFSRLFLAWLRTFAKSQRVHGGVGRWGFSSCDRVRVSLCAFVHLCALCVCALRSCCVVAILLLLCARVRVCFFFLRAAGRAAARRDGGTRAERQRQRRLRAPPQLGVPGGGQGRSGGLVSPRRPGPRRCRRLPQRPKRRPSRWPERWPERWR